MGFPGVSVGKVHAVKVSQPMPESSLSRLVTVPRRTRMFASVLPRFMLAGAVAV